MSLSLTRIVEVFVSIILLILFMLVVVIPTILLDIVFGNYDVKRT